MYTKPLAVIIGICFFSGIITIVSAQESLRIRAVPTTFTNIRVPLPEESVTVVSSENSGTVETSLVETPGTVTVTSSTSSSSVTCTKTTSGPCIIFSCSDGTKTNTCTIACTSPEPASPTLVGAVATDEPKITSFFPESGNAGTQVRVYLTKGQKAFSGPDSIEIGGVKAKMVLWSNVPGTKADFYADIIVPDTAKTGKITITKPQTFAKPGSSDKDFFVIPVQDAPFITAITPLAGYPGQEVTIEYYMGTKKFSGLDSIEIAGVPAKIIAHSNVPSKKPNAYMDKIIIPADAKTGKITLNKKIFGSVASTQDFTVVPATDAPTILSFSPEGGSSGDKVTLKVVAGKKSFSAPDAIYIGEVQAEIISSSADTSGIKTYIIKVPENAKTGKIIFRKPGAFVDVATADDFKVYGPVKAFIHKLFSNL